MSTFNSNSTLLGGTNTNYTCTFSNNYIINISTERLFNMSGGILKCGGSTSYNFAVVEYNTAHFSIHKMEIVFLSDLDSFILIKGGTVSIIGVKIQNQKQYWVNPLVEVIPSISIVNVEFHFNNIIECAYNCNNLYHWSSIIEFRGTGSYSVNVNISFCLFYNNSFSLFDGNSFKGGGVMILYHMDTPWSVQFN
jgi:hypothetical protein